jgi:hypothetical protein
VVSIRTQVINYGFRAKVRWIARSTSQCTPMSLCFIIERRVRRSGEHKSEITVGPLMIFLAAFRKFWFTLCQSALHLRISRSSTPSTFSSCKMMTWDNWIEQHCKCLSRSSQAVLSEPLKDRRFSVEVPTCQGQQR